MAKVVGPGHRNIVHRVVTDMDAVQHVELKHVRNAPLPGELDPGPYTFDRRRCARGPACGSRLAVVFGVEGGRWLLPLELRDTSASGLGAISAQALNAGDRVTLYDEGRRATFIRGTVTRCQEREDGQYDLGLTY